jgi:kelch-like protein 20/kelch-like protein 24/35
VQVIVAVGGEDDKVVLRSVECYDPLSHQWHTLACLPFAVRYCEILIMYETLTK